jgi:hypothetical protein
VRAELRRKIVAKYREAVEFLFAKVLPGSPKEKKIWIRIIRGGSGRTVGLALDAKLKTEPDDRFQALMADLDSMDLNELVRLALTTGFAHLPKKRGGRPPTFSLEARRLAVQDIGNEYPRCDSFTEAVNLVAARYEMRPEYLRKVWKNRKRLRQRED